MACSRFRRFFLQYPVTYNLLMVWIRSWLYSMVVLVVCAQMRAQTPAAAYAATFAPTGTLRAAFLGDNPALGRVDSKTGAVTGPVAEIVKEIARRVGVP